MKKIKAWGVQANGVMDKWWETSERDFYAVFPKKFMASDYAKENEGQSVVRVIISYAPAGKKKK